MRQENILLGFIILGIFGVILLILLYMALKHLKSVIQWLKSSLQDPATGNASSKRLSGLWMMVLVSMVHFVWLKKAFMENSFTLLPEILWADLSFVSVALGISAWQTVKKNGNTETKTETKTE